jgi:hypothetical protein
VPLITLCYNLNGFSKLYSKEFFNKHKQILEKFIDEDDDLISANPGEEIDCEECLSKKPSIYLKYYNISVCEDCTRDYIMKILEKRVSVFVKDNCINRECKINSFNILLDYIRKIELKEGIFLDDFICYILLGDSINGLIVQLAKKLCFSCQNFFTEIEHTSHNICDLVTLECSCQMCKNCIKENLQKATQNYFILNIFEKSK